MKTENLNSMLSTQGKIYSSAEARKELQQLSHSHCELWIALRRAKQICEQWPRDNKDFDKVQDSVDYFNSILEENK